ncbi:hypothetical protein K227x_43510 [Rubripirellula lacrimiformis]|uniref:Uncharacterized protein n=1 Tax=Rubripirellula lacrimiformis TaxID=1930273 RepID=A0A517NFP9_9BACT|nr:hypothetical protein K227x_43510 [Rubripirellula lacrimiformis]
MSPKRSPDTTQPDRATGSLRRVFGGGSQPLATTLAGDVVNVARGFQPPDPFAVLSGHDPRLYFWIRQRDAKLSMMTHHGARPGRRRMG